LAARPPPPSPPNPPPPTPTHAHPSRATPLENVSKKDWHIPVGMVWGRSAGCPELHKVCKVSVLVYFLYKLTMYRTFENFLPTDCRHRCKSRQILFLFISYFFWPAHVGALRRTSRKEPCPPRFSNALILESQCPGVFTIKNHCRQHFWEFMPNALMRGVRLNGTLFFHSQVSTLAHLL